ncbi:MAG: hypothetical protein GWP37_03010, partial [Gammaproteobacteria bacterium]|nr:hypothetical protein [Gammaproteobacteria bacterium]
MAVLFSNNAATNLSAGINASVTSITVSDASEFPTLGASDHTFATLSNLTETTIEVVKVTAISGNTLTVVRGQDNTTAASFVSGDKCELRMTAALLTDVVSEALALTGGTMSGALNMGSQNITNAGTIGSGAITSSGLTLSNGGDRSITGPQNQSLIIDARPNDASEGLKFSINGTDKLSILQDGNATFAGTISSGAIVATGTGTTSSTNTVEFKRN